MQTAQDVQDLMPAIFSCACNVSRRGNSSSTLVGQAQVEVLDILVLSQGLGSVIHDDAPCFHDVGIGRHIQGQLGILLHQEDGNALSWLSWLMILKISWMSLGARPMEGSSRRTSLGSVMSALPTTVICCSPAADEPRRLVALLSKPGEIVVDQLKPFLDGTGFSKVGADLEVLFHGQVFKNPASFNDLDNALPGNVRSMVMVDVTSLILNGAVGHFAVLGFEQSGDGFKGGAFPGAVGPEKGDDAAFGTTMETPLSTRITSWYLTSMLLILRMDSAASKGLPSVDDKIASRFH
jgi:hypothetical protein